MIGMGGKEETVSQKVVCWMAPEGSIKKGKTGWARIVDAV